MKNQISENELERDEKNLAYFVLFWLFLFFMLEIWNVYACISKGMSFGKILFEVFVRPFIFN